MVERKAEYKAEAKTEHKIYTVDLICKNCAGVFAGAEFEIGKKIDICKAKCLRCGITEWALK